MLSGRIRDNWNPFSENGLQAGADKLLSDLMWQGITEPDMTGRLHNLPVDRDKATNCPQF